MRYWILLIVVYPALACVPSVAPAAFPGQNGKIAFFAARDGNQEIYVMNSDGTDQTNVTNSASSDVDPAWSPDGTKIAFHTDRDGNQEIYVMNADGTGLINVTNNPAFDAFPSWSPDGTKIAFQSDRDGVGNFEIYSMNADGTGQVRLTNNPVSGEFSPAWSPDGAKIAFHTNRDDPTQQEVYVMNANGTGQTNVTNNPAIDGYAAWSPDGSMIAFQSSRDGDAEIYSMNTDGTGLTRLTNDPAFDGVPAWAPDGSKLAFESSRDNPSAEEIYVMNADGTGQTRVTNNPGADQFPDWQPILQPPIDGYARPKSATPTTIRLVPAFDECTSANGSHGAPLDSASCNTPIQSSAFLTFGAPERPTPYNTAANGSGSVVMKVFCTDGATPPCTTQAGDQQDVQISTSVTGVRCVVESGGCSAAGGQYAGKLLGRVTIRMTDRLNGSAETSPATVTDFPLTLGLQCSGGGCSSTTSADAVMPGLAKEGKRAIWALSQIEVLDGGADGKLVATLNGTCPPACEGNDGETVFLRQGLFAP